MKKIISLILVIIAVLSLSSCSSLDTNSLGKVVTPDNSIIPLYGEWEIYDALPGDITGKPDENMSGWVGKRAVFSDMAAVFNDDVCIKPVYKLKQVSSVDYLLYQYKISPGYLDIKSEDIQAVSITSQNQFFHEFIKLSDIEAIVYIDGYFLYLKKVSPTVDEAYIENLVKNNSDKQNLQSNLSDSRVYSGILLGLRSNKNTNSKTTFNEYEYRTLWIYSENIKSKNIYSTDGLFVPRKSGFWRIEVNRESHQGFIQDVITAYPNDKEDKGETIITAPFDKSLQKSILYVGNDYVSTEVSPVLSNNKASYLEVLPIDNIEGASPIKISDIAGQNGTDALYEGALKLMDTDLTNDNRHLYKFPDEDSFYISRRNGHWIMRGRINPIAKDIPFMDFNIKIIPPSRLVTYDDLKVSWSAIRDRVSDAIDAYTSPNNDMALITTPNSILVYAIENSELSQDPLTKVKLKDKETVVMAEWSMGGYTNKWDREFLKNDTTEVGE